MANENQNTTRIVIAVVGIVVIGGLWLALKSHRPSRDAVKVNKATVTAIDVAGRRATVEFIHSKSGQLISMDGDLPDDDKIRIDGKPATIRDVRVGDKVVLERKDKQILSVNVERELPMPESRPTATAPAGGV